jgi:dynein intermediate chain
MRMTYDKETQVEEGDYLFMAADEDEPQPNKQQSPSKNKQSSTSALNSGNMRKDTKQASADEESKKTERKVMSKSEYQKTVSQSKFGSFLSRSSLLVERALDQTDSMDIIRDFASKSELKSKSKTFNIFIPYEEESLKTRPIMDIKWSELIPEIFLVAYGDMTDKRSMSGLSDEQKEKASPGLVCVWSKDFHSRPEYKFSAPSPVMSAVFHSTEEHIVIGGCYSGQILLWDMRSKSFPVQRSSMSGKGHKHPVYAMAMMNAAVSGELVSVSTDGMLCHWDVSRLQDPLITVFLNYPSPQSLLPGHFDLGDADSKGPLNVCSMAFEQTETTTNILFGTGSGQVFRSNLPYRATNPPINELNAHLGLVTSIRPHCSQIKNHKSLLLTSSLDWTVKLWNLNNMTTPILEFYTPDYDYVCDVEWSPANFAIFSTITSGGRLTLWNVSKSTTSPLDEIMITQDASKNDTDKKSATAVATSVAGGRKSANAALTKSVWSKDGLSILVGDSVGKVHCITINKSQVESSTAEEEQFEAAISMNEQKMQ